MASEGFYPDLDILGTPAAAAILREEPGPWHDMPRDARPEVPENWPRTIYLDRFKS
jgi:hypothetical protein